MKIAIPALLSLLLVASTGTELLAQTPPDVVSVPELPNATTQGRSSSPGILGAGPVTPELWTSYSADGAVEPQQRSRDVAPVEAWSDWSTEKRIWVVGGIVVGLMVLGLLSLG